MPDAPDPTPISTLTLTRPDDWHLHLRDGAAMAAVVPDTARQFARAIVMPNLKPPVTTAAQALAYADRIRAAVPEGMAFEPLMTLYLTDRLPPDEIARARDAGVVAVKLYPAGATTNSDAGVTDLRHTRPTLEAMQRLGLPLLVHGEVTDPAIDLFDREAVFIDTQLIPLRRDFPELKIIFEHITTREAAQYVAEAGAHTLFFVRAHMVGQRLPAPGARVTAAAGWPAGPPLTYRGPDLAAVAEDSPPAALLALKVPGAAEGAPALAFGDWAALRPALLGWAGVELAAPVVSVDGGHVLVALSADAVAAAGSAAAAAAAGGPLLFHVRFLPPRTAFVAAHKALGVDGVARWVPDEGHQGPGDRDHGCNLPPDDVDLWAPAAHPPPARDPDAGVASRDRAVRGRVRHGAATPRAAIFFRTFLTSMSPANTASYCAA
jgi:hypothetical protein